MCPYYNANVLQLTCATVLLTIRTTPPRETLLVPVLQYIRDTIVQYLRRFFTLFNLDGTDEVNIPNCKFESNNSVLKN